MFLQDHYDIAFNLTSIFDRFKLSLTCNGKQFEMLRQVVDLLARTEKSRRRNPKNSHIEVMFQYYRKHSDRNKFKYDHTNSKRIDIRSAISTVIMSYKSTNEVYTLDKNDLEQLPKFVIE
jgi:hypothetical protein